MENVVAKHEKMCEKWQFFAPKTLIFEREHLKTKACSHSQPFATIFGQK